MITALIVIAFAFGVVAAFGAYHGVMLAHRHRRALRMAGRLGLPAPKPSTEPTAGEVVLWMIDPSRGGK